MAAGPSRALLVLVLVLWGRAVTAQDDALSRLGRAAWEALESGLGPQPLRAVAEFLSHSLWVVSAGIAAALSALCGSLADLLAAAGVSGSPAVRAAAPGAGAVQRVLLWALAALALSGLGSRLRPLLLPLLRGARRCCFLGAFLWVAGSARSPTAQAALLLALWGLHCLLPPAAPRPPLEAAVRSLEWKVEELRRRQQWGGPRNREE
ncbi:transmembrane protein 109 isoform X2 [Strigops habroptila]|nr:transmembrane protein 109 isoform X2 [Strigops habroptila]